ncbi:MAG: 2-succinyl-5-enolpyruvyl-6-hydroxy-3-cyclohexene-1-carboxylic-acid synthase [Oscillospiraceae bacterium]|nr:2-succinyl-5-enolpyruvyl-6-hydroxy-3-cyclohexene-1-carboxylic-acid synthase [Oscillospiraceae bacterium]
MDKNTNAALQKSAEKTQQPVGSAVKAAPAPAVPSIDPLFTNPDFIKIRLLATLLRDYGIKHVVLSPGGRDVPLVRMFEYNEGQFILHRVTDERSAAYFGLGIAAQLQQPVACICTSGTAASNYLPAVTEAYYTGVPLIVVTADRREIYHEHGEDQTIPQRHIYDNVVKKSVTLPEGSGYHAEYQTRRDISDCILEATHNGFGPVHINISIDNISVGATAPREKWKLLPYIYPHILRVGAGDGAEQMMKWVDTLKKSKRILIVYGQNARPTERQRKNIEAFASKFNCVIVTDFIANLDCAYSLKPHNMLQAITGKEFNEQLAPEILITVGGKRLMNDPLTFKIRGGPKNIRHWSVTPDGKVKDFYFRLTSVIEAPQDYFFEWFAAHAGEIRNDGVYYEKWRQLTAKYTSPVITQYTSNFIQSKFFPSVPPNSIVHLGVGQTFFDCRRYTLDKSVEVFCNMGTNGIDGCTSTFMGQCAVVKDKLCFLIVGDLSFFYDMNGIWNKQLDKNMRIMMINNNGTSLLRAHNLKAILSVHNTKAQGWVESTGFDYISAHSKEEYEEKLKYFVSEQPEKALFFEVFCD